MAIASSIIAAGIGAVGAVAASRSASRGAQQAANTTAQSNAESQALQRDIYNQNRDILNPYVTRGNEAGGAIQGLLGFGDSTAADNAFARYQDSSGYQFRFDEGNRALNSANAAGGNRLSGAALRGALRYGQDYASGEYGRYLGYLGNQQGVGLSAASATAGVGQNYANNITALNQNTADARANAQLYSANQNANLIGGLAGLGANLFGQSSYGGGQSYSAPYDPFRAAGAY